MIYGIIITAAIILIILYLEFRAFSIPVLYYHHIEPTDPVTPEVFEAQIKYLLSKGYNSISLNELHEFMLGKLKVARKSFVLTYDDGFYCNYHYLFPILKRYNLKATIFVVSAVRKQLSNKQGKEQGSGYPSRTGANEEAVNKFASWDELKTMLSSGLVQIEDHSLFHDRIYISNTVKGFNTDIDPDWPVYGDTASGTVRYKTGSYLAYKKFTGDIKLNDYLVNFIKEKNSEPSDHKTIKELKQAYKTYKKHYPVKHTYESMDNYERRCKTDMEKSRQTIETHTKIRPMFFCFPWGQYNKTLLRILKELGYKGAVTTDKGANVRGGNPYGIKRFKVYRSDLQWFKRYFFIHRSRVLATLYSIIYGWL